jgi:hypothetical protein
MDYSKFILDIKKDTEMAMDQMKNVIMASMQEKMFAMMKAEYEEKKEISLLLPKDLKSTDKERIIAEAIFALCGLTHKKGSLHLGESHVLAEADFKDFYYSRYIQRSDITDAIINQYDAFSYDCCEWILKILTELYPEHHPVLYRDYSSVLKHCKKCY